MTRTMTTPLLSAALALNLTGVLSPFLETPSRKAREGNARYAAGDWEGAATHYAEAASMAKDGAYAYNLGTANYRKKDYAGAVEALGRAGADAKLDLGQVAYNIGNAKFQSGDLEGALGAYRAALSAHPEDEDARSNYELTLRELQRQQQNQNQNQEQNQNEESNQDNQQDQNQKNQENQQGESDQDSQQDQKDQTGEKKESQEGEENPKNDRPSDENQAQEPPPSSVDSSAVRPQEPGQMSPQEAARLLNAVTPKERELLQARLKPTRKHRAEKDW